MKIETYSSKFWALSIKGDNERELLGPFSWPIGISGDPDGVLENSVMLFNTRKEAKKAKKTCCYKKTHVERVLVTVGPIEHDS